MNIGNVKCPDCHVEMVPGWELEEYEYRKGPPQWVEGLPVLRQALLGEYFARHSQQFVLGFSCPKCRLIRQYAVPKEVVMAIGRSDGASPFEKS